MQAPSSADTFATTSSQVLGGFYGAAAAETAGTVTAAGTRTSGATTNGVFLGGGFGGKKQ